MSQRRRRSTSLRPPQMPCGSLMRTANSRQDSTTGHSRQINAGLCFLFAALLAYSAVKEALA